MRIGIVSSAMPLVQGGGRFIVDWLELKLREHGHAVEVVYVPYTDELDRILPQMNAFRLLELEEGFDRVITFRPPAHVVRHSRKVVWFIHHLRVFYDLWDTPYRYFPDNMHHRGLRDTIVQADTAALAEAHRVFTNSRVVADRLKQYNGIEGEVLYPPILTPELFTSGEYGDEIVSVCRIEHHKRQHLLVDAMRHTRTPVRLRLCGSSLSPGYAASLHETVAQHGLQGRVLIEERWVTEEEKADRLSRALASAYVPYDEDSYGYPTIEAAHARRCTVTVADSGGVPEFVDDGVTGLTTAPEAEALAEAFDRLYADRALARRLGDAANERIAALGIDWDTVIAKLLA